MPRLLLAAVAAGLAALVLAPAAVALIQVDRGIAGARLGNTRAQVLAALGRPARVTSGTNDFGPFTVFRYRGGITVAFQAGRVTGVRTTGPGDRTRLGVGVGSTERAVRARVAGVRCETIGGSRSCHTGRFLPGQRVTDFRLRNGRVRSVVVAVVLD
jgi:hypothetical protein